MKQREFVDKVLEIHNNFSYPDSQFYRGDKEQYQKFTNQVLRIFSQITK